MFYYNGKASKMKSYDTLQTPLEPSARGLDGSFSVSLSPANNANSRFIHHYHLIARTISWTTIK
ncbi:hypothetical protein BELL_0027g00070 [Botrytis elliptica]|uniref:Uncharacterized protein n=1 Tax=Botrytis elliptica TaxID=278938 RepID=A0A4Z1K223_9HELO|nr:hypothetical protein BELL_0027g00070 [Botrytis elliptica]